ncbi:MAG: hypothetical protein ACPGXZ_14045 [Saprospiraceae bacterium]
MYQKQNRKQVKRSEHKYKVIVKCDNEKFAKWNTSNLLSLVLFLNRKFPDWRYFNVYCKKSRIQLDNFTKNKLPRSKHL